jgi:hypothetical protein
MHAICRSTVRRLVARFDEVWHGAAVQDGSREASLGRAIRPLKG